MIQYTVTVAHNGETYRYPAHDMETAYRIAATVGPQGARVCVDNRRTGTSALVREGDDQGAGTQNQKAGDQNEMFIPQPYPVLIESAYRTDVELVEELLGVLEGITAPSGMPQVETLKAELRELSFILSDDEYVSVPRDTALDAAQAVNEMLWEVEQLINAALPGGWMLETYDGCWIVHEVEQCALCEEYYPAYEASDHADWCEGIRDYPYGTRVDGSTLVALVEPSRHGRWMMIDELSYSDMAGSYIEVANCHWIKSRYPYDTMEATGPYGTVQLLIRTTALVEHEELAEAIRGMFDDYPIIDEMEAGELEQEIIRDAWDSWIAREMLDEAYAVCEDAGDDAAAEAVSNMTPYQAKAIADEVTDGELEYAWEGAFSPSPTFSDSQREAVTIAIVDFARELVGQGAAA